MVQLLHAQARAGRLIISSHHDLATVREMFDQVLVINNKRQITFGSVAEVYHAATLEAGVWLQLFRCRRIC